MLIYITTIIYHHLNSIKCQASIRLVENYQYLLTSGKKVKVQASLKKYVTLSAKTRIVCASMHIEKNKIKFFSSVIMHGLMGQQSAKEASNQQNYIPSYSHGYGEFKIFVSFL